MPKLPDKFEDWTAPWQEDEFDADKAAHLVFNAMKAAEKAKARNSALEAEKSELDEKLTDANDKLERVGKPADETAKDAEIAALKKANRDLTSKGRPEDQARIERLSVAMDHGLTARDAERLVGSTREELEEDAADLAERLGVGKSGAEGEEGKEGPGTEGHQGPPQRGVLPKAQAKNGRKVGEITEAPSVDQILVERYGRESIGSFPL